MKRTCGPPGYVIHGRLRKENRTFEPSLDNLKQKSEESTWVVSPGGCVRDRSNLAGGGLLVKKGSPLEQDSGP